MGHLRWTGVIFVAFDFRNVKNPVKACIKLKAFPYCSFKDVYDHLPCPPPCMKRPDGVFSEVKMSISVVTLTCIGSCSVTILHFYSCASKARTCNVFELNEDVYVGHIDDIKM